MSDAQQAAAAQKAEQVVERSLLDQVVEEGQLARDPAVRDRGKDLVKEFVTQVLQGEMTISRDTEAMINARIAQIDHLLSIQLNEIIHHPSFQKLESTWRGLKYLLDNTETSVQLKIRVINVSKRELLRDFQRAPEFDQSAAFMKIYTEEFGQYGGEPFGALIGDYEFSRTSEDIELLEKISQVAAAAHAPFLTAASPEMFGLDSYTSLGQPRDLAKIFDQTLYAKWKSFRESEDSRYVGLTLPRMLLREPYGPDGRSVDAFDYREGVDGTDHSKYLWGNAAWALGARLTASFAENGWCASIRGVEGGGKVEGLPVHNFTTDEGDIALKCPTEIAISDRREKELADLGFIALVHCKGKDHAAFFSAQSAQKPKVYQDERATANARLSSALPYILAISRFAHYLKVMMRDKVGSFMSRAETERYLNDWIHYYVTEDDQASQETKRQYPLRDARVDVEEIPGKPGCYRAVAYLRPHFQLEELTVSLRLVAELPARAQK